MTMQDYLNPYGTWRVTTEGDCEGKSTRDLGVYVGYIDDIAFALSEKCFYALEFTKVCADVPKPKTIRENVNVNLNIESKTWKMSSKERVLFFQNMLKGRDVHVSEGTSYASVTLSKDNIELTKREIALSKLTDEEKELLGLK